VPDEMLKKADMMLKLTRLYTKVQLISYESILKNPRAKLDSMLDRIEQYAIELDNMVESHLTYDLTPIYSMDVEVCHDDNRPKI